MGIILKNEFVVTVCKHENDIAKVLCNGKYRGLRTTKRYRFVLYALLETATRFLGQLREINRTVEILEDKLQQSTRNSELLALLKYQKSLVYFTTALRSNEVMMERLQRMRLFNQYDDDQELLEDVLTENQQAIQTTNITTEILSSMMDAFASIISNNLNGVMKVLAALTIILNLPAIVAAFYGMNVTLPGEQHPLAFIGVFGLAIGLTAVATFIFYKRDWF
jgi:magnesium transporter